MSDLLSDYLSYLNEQGVAGRLARATATYARGAARRTAAYFSPRTVAKELAPKAVATTAKAAAKASISWYLALVPGAWTAWRLAQAMFSQAARKCGVFSAGPGRKLCILREKIRALEQQIRLLKAARTQCSSKAANPEVCRSQLDAKIQELESKLLSLQMQKQSTEALPESTTVVDEGIAALGLFVLFGLVVDKILFLAWRTLRAAFDKDLRRCGIYKDTDEHKLCVYTARLKFLRSKASFFMRLMRECPKQKDPDKCREKLRKKIQELQPQIQRQLDNISVVKRQIQDKKAAEAITGGA